MLAGAFDWVDVRDVAVALASAAESGAIGANYLVGGHQTTLRELADTVSRVTGAAPPPVTLPMWFARAWTPLADRAGRITGNPMWYTADTLHALRFPPNLATRQAEVGLGHRPRPLADTIADFFQWTDSLNRTTSGSR